MRSAPVGRRHEVRPSPQRGGEIFRGGPRGGMEAEKSAYNMYGMRLVSEIANLLAVEELSVTRVQYTVVDGRGGVFQNVKKLVEFSADNIVLAGKKGRLRVSGSGLSLGKCSAGDVTVLGDIQRVERDDAQG